MCEDINIERTEKGFKVISNINTNEIINNMLDFEKDFINEMNRKIIIDANEAIIQALLNRINQGISYMEQFKTDTETGGIDVEYILKILKGE